MGNFLWASQEDISGGIAFHLCVELEGTVRLGSQGQMQCALRNQSFLQCTLGLLGGSDKKKRSGISELSFEA